jgi:hypothetical protein
MPTRELRTFDPTDPFLRVISDSFHTPKMLLHAYTKTRKMTLWAALEDATKPIEEIKKRVADATVKGNSHVRIPHDVMDDFYRLNMPVHDGDEKKVDQLNFYSWPTCGPTGFSLRQATATNVPGKATSKHWSATNLARVLWAVPIGSLHKSGPHFRLEASARGGGVTVHPMSSRDLHEDVVRLCEAMNLYGPTCRGFAPRMRASRSHYADISVKNEAGENIRVILPKPEIDPDALTCRGARILARPIWRGPNHIDGYRRVHLVFSTEGERARKQQVVGAMLEQLTVMGDCLMCHLLVPETTLGDTHAYGVPHEGTMTHSHVHLHSNTEEHYQLTGAEFVALLQDAEAAPGRLLRSQNASMQYFEAIEMGFGDGDADEDEGFEDGEEDAGDAKTGDEDDSAVKRPTGTDALDNRTMADALRNEDYRDPLLTDSRAERSALEKAVDSLAEMERLMKREPPQETFTERIGKLVGQFATTTLSAVIFFHVSRGLTELWKSASHAPGGTPVDSPSKASAPGPGLPKIASEQTSLKWGQPFPPRLDQSTGEVRTLFQKCCVVAPVAAGSGAVAPLKKSPSGNLVPLIVANKDDPDNTTGRTLYLNINYAPNPKWSVQARWQTYTPTAEELQQVQSSVQAATQIVMGGLTSKEVGAQIADKLKLYESQRAAYDFAGAGETLAQVETLLNAQKMAFGNTPVTNDGAASVLDKASTAAANGDPENAQRLKNEALAVYAQVYAQNQQSDPQAAKIAADQITKLGGDLQALLSLTGNSR